MVRKFSLALISVLFLAQAASAVTVGTAPGVKELGTLEKGKTYPVVFYITTNANENFEVRPEYSRPLQSVYEFNSARSYDFNPSKASQQDMSDWVDFTQESYTINPDNTTVISLENGALTQASAKVKFFLRIPKNAEPGYHMGSVDLNPQFESEGGLRTIGESEFSFVFKLPGNAERDVEVLRVEGLRSDDNSARIDIVVRNEGTLSTRVGGRGKVFKGGFKEGGFTTGSKIIRPGEIEVVKGSWYRNDGELSSGDYEVRGEVQFVTGDAPFREGIDISDVVQIRDRENPATGPQNEVVEKTNDMPIWFIVMLLVLVGVLMYAFEIDPIYIIAVMGILGISAFIMISDLPVYLIGVVVLITAGLIVYGRM